MTNIRARDSQRRLGHSDNSIGSGARRYKIIRCRHAPRRKIRLAIYATSKIPIGTEAIIVTMSKYSQV